MVNGLGTARLPDGVRAFFDARLGPRMSATAFAPGRVNLIGAHLDYNEGPVQPIPLDRGTFAAVAPREDGRIGLASLEQGEAGPFTLDDLPGVRDLRWAAYPIGLAATLKGDGVTLPGFDLAVAGNLDIGAGLSSSASLLVACARALNAAFDLGLDHDAIAMLAYRAETGFVGVSCGIMDPMAASVALPGHTLLLDCRDRSYSHVPFDTERLGLVVIDSGTRRSLANSRFNQRVEECRRAAEVIGGHHPEVRTLRDATLSQVEAHEAEMGSAVARRARHVVREVARVYEFKESLARREFARCGELISACHRDLKELFEASTDALDFLAETASSADGVLGARLTGAGWGGSVLALTERGAEDGLRRLIADEYPRHFGREPRFQVLGAG